MTSSIIKRCIDNLQPLRSIPATYRMTNKPIPEHPTFFVANILTPITEFIRSGGESLPESTKRAWTTKIINAVTERYLYPQLYQSYSV